MERTQVDAGGFFSGKLLIERTYPLCNAIISGTFQYIADVASKVSFKTRESILSVETIQYLDR